MFAALSLSGGKRTCQNKQPRTITQRTEQDAGDLLKGKTLSPLQGSLYDKSKFRATSPFVLYVTAFAGRTQCLSR
jgi:hypothetical protein